MMDVLKIPSDDRFQLIVEHSPENMIQDRVFFGIERSDDSVSVQIVVNHRDPSQKLKMYELIVDNLAESPGIRKEDVFIGVVEVARENWWVTSRFPGRHPGYQQAGMSARRNPRRAADTGCCRGVPGIRATIEQTSPCIGLDHHGAPWPLRARWPGLAAGCGLADVAVAGPEMVAGQHAGLDPVRLPAGM